MRERLIIMKRILACLLVLLGVAQGASASEGTVPLDKFQKERVTDIAALQNGAKLFVNYCLNCHAAAFMRFNRLRDIGLGDEQIKKNLLFTSEKVGDLMTVSLDPKQAKDWFGAVPPDLSVIARSRASGGGSGADYLYTYLRSFYRDDSRPTGWNNTVFPAVGMPHVLWELEGEKRAVFAEEKDAHDPNKTAHVFKGFETIKPGKMTKAEYDQAMGDLVAYMVWMAEPVQNQRVRLGVWVLIALGIFTLIAWRLNAAYWKDIK
jgi:ubiquinol-cytochrome c reductase cytochrome c1 subunit